MSAFGFAFSASIASRRTRLVRGGTPALWRYAPARVHTPAAVAGASAI